MTLAVRESHEFHDPTFEPALGVPHVKCEAEALCKQELWRDDVFWCGFGQFRSKGSEGDIVILGLCSEEESGGHEFFGVVGHGRVVEVEALEELDCRGLGGVSFEL